jgi:cell division protein FtsZ
LINLDFADVRTIMSGMGSAVMGTGEAAGEHRASAAAEEAVANPLLDEVSLKGAKGLLLSITGGRDLTLYEVDEAASRVRQEVDPEANIIVGATFDETLGDRVRVSIVASGMARQGEHLQAPVDPRLRTTRPQAAPPPPPQRPEMHRGFPHPQQHAAPDDMQRRLSEAIGVNGEEAPRESHAPQQRETWRAPGNVVIEEGFSQMSWAPPQAARGQAPAENAKATGQFIPAPPADLRRGARRMPDVEDFPPVAQREYRAKAGHAPQGAPPPPPQAPSEEPPRRGILQRIMGRARREEMDDPPTSNAAPDPRRMSNSSSDDWWAAERDSQDQDESDDRAPLPEFFNRQRK